MTRNYPRHFCYATYSTYMHVWPKNGDPSTASASCNNHTHTLACMRNVDYDPLMDTYSNSNTAAHRRRRPTGTVAQYMYTVQYTAAIYTHVKSSSLYMHVQCKDEVALEPGRPPATLWRGRSTQLLLQKQRASRPHRTTVPVLYAAQVPIKPGDPP
jgi:hypothetical protein